ncbi:MAG: carbonic anhydrase/acetyltransferase-like protein (isoleucine patch superfamily) [Polyangiales bacterium]|jgi:carbonic anhydrase/acetyltransferase-like protein (isoleucine patch superfamily)
MIRVFRGRRPSVSSSAYIDESAQLIGDVRVGERSSIWCNVTVRGDVEAIRIGANTSIQDNSCLHVDYDKSLEIGNGVTVGHSCTVHGCIIGDDCLIGMGATILSGARIGAGSIVAAGALVTEGQQVPERSLVMGVPAKVKRNTSDEDLRRLRDNADRYVRLSREYLGDS